MNTHWYIIDAFKKSFPIRYQIWDIIQTQYDKIKLHLMWSFRNTFHTACLNKCLYWYIFINPFEKSLKLFLKEIWIKKLVFFIILIEEKKHILDIFPIKVQILNSMNIKYSTIWYDLISYKHLLIEKKSTCNTCNAALKCN